MAEYINREEALSELYLLMAEHEDDQFEGKLLHWTGIKAILERLPAADVVERKTGRWLMRGGQFSCSVCGSKALWLRQGSTGGWSHEYNSERSNYCPHCGAQMIGGDDDV